MPLLKTPGFSELLLGKETILRTMHLADIPKYVPLKVGNICFNRWQIFNFPSRNYDWKNSWL